MKTINKTKSQVSRRAGFTLLELLGVVAILSILVALILPAVMNAWSRAEVTAVNAEFTSLTGAITKFQTDFNDQQPWSYVVFEEDGSGWDAASKSRIRRIWPQYNFSAAVDINGDGDTTDTIEMSGSECLVFFLGGVRNSSGNLIGFSNSPINPFKTTGESRTVPYPFDAARLGDADGDGMLEYADEVSGVPILYISSNNGKGYSRLNGAPNYYVQSDGTTPWNKDGFQLISAGDDGEYGFDVAPNPFDSSGGASDVRPKFEAGKDVILQQRDNIVNFHSGTLEDG